MGEYPKVIEVNGEQMTVSSVGEEALWREKANEKSPAPPPAHETKATKKPTHKGVAKKK